MVAEGRLTSASSEAWGSLMTAASGADPLLLSRRQSVLTTLMDRLVEARSNSQVSIGQQVLSPDTQQGQL